MIIDDVIKSAKRIHFIGIGGSGMCPLAEILHAQGHYLTGSDNNESDTLKRIRALGIPVTMGQKAENVEGASWLPPRKVAFPPSSAVSFLAISQENMITVSVFAELTVKQLLPQCSLIF